jgi:hypothetical protein
MLLNRIAKLTDLDIFYHYCTAGAFEAILKTGTIRFSDINMMNDAQEVRWGYRIFIEAANELLELSRTKPRLKGMDKGFFDEVDKIISPFQMYLHPFISCFSREADMLSQWRAYADNGRGFAVGFDGRALKHMPVTLLAVEYDRTRQLSEMKEALGALFLENEADASSFGSKFRQSCLLLGGFMAAFKNPGFKEEKEIRCLHVVGAEITESSIKLTDKGGLIGGTEEVAGEEIKFRTYDNALVAFLDIPFGRGFPRCPIREIVLGPSHPGRPGNVLIFLNHMGYTGVSIRQSEISYR